MKNEKIMVFIDGSNILNQLGKMMDFNVKAEKASKELLIVAKDILKIRLGPINGYSKGKMIRKYWFGSYSGSQQDCENYHINLKSLGFEPVLFKKGKTSKEKGVDISLAKEMLVNAFNQNYTIGWVIAGDGDYVPLIQEVKRYGQKLYGAFFSKGLSSELQLSFDKFWLLDDTLNDTEVTDSWERYINSVSGAKLP